MGTFCFDASLKIRVNGDAKSAVRRNWQDMGLLWKLGETAGQIALARDAKLHVYEFDSSVAGFAHSASCPSGRTDRNGRG